MTSDPITSDPVTPPPAAVWPRTARLDAPAVLDRIADITGVRLTLDGPCPGGEVGAAYVTWPDGRRSVLTEGRTSTAPLVDRARAAGVPTARHQMAAHVDGVRVIVQERLPGTPPTTVGATLIEQMIDVTDRLAGLLIDEPGTPTDLYLTGDGPGFCLHEPLATHSARTARLLDWVHEVGADCPAMLGDDLVHLDFHPGNVLVDASGRLTGVIDWDGARRGDRHFDLVTLAFTLAGQTPTRQAPTRHAQTGQAPTSPAPIGRAHKGPALAGPALARPAVARQAEPPPTGRIHDRLALISERRRRAYWAHMSLRQVDWSIRHHDAATVEHWLDVAEREMS